MKNALHRFDNVLRLRPGDDPGQTAFTPAYILDPVRATLGGVIALDPCTTSDNPTRAENFYALPQDGLAESWQFESIFCNPPYGRSRIPWVERCVYAGACGSRVVLLIPAHTDTVVFQRAAVAASSVLFVQGRVKFGIPRANGRQIAASHPSVLVGFNVDLSSAGLGVCL